MSHPLVIPPEFNTLSKVEQIEFYIENGLLIHPCYGPKATNDGIDPGKTPRWSVPQRLKATSKERLEAFSNGNSEDNVGLVPVAPHIRLDVDDRTEDKRGLAAFEILHPNLFGDNLRVRTADGWHFELYCPDVPPGQTKITIRDYLPGVNIEIFVGEGLNVICPPSVHRKGIRYEYQGIRELELVWLGLLAAVQYKAEGDSQSREKRHSVTQPDWKTAFKGDLRTLDLVALVSELGLYGKEAKENRDGYIVHTCRCPWRDEHDHNRSEEWSGQDSSTAILTAAGRMPGFSCLHGHCTDRKLPELLLYIESEHPGLVDKFCLRSWTIEPQTGYRSSDRRIKGHNFPDGFFGPVGFPRIDPPIWRQEVIYPQDSILHPYLEFARKLTEGADCYILGSILPVASRLLARRAYIPFGATQLYANIYSILIGPPGDRKSFTIQLAEKVAAFCLTPEAFLTHRHSREGLVDEYDETCGGSPDKLYAVDDAASVLAHWKTQLGESLADTFLRLYDCRELSETYRRNKKETAEQQPRRIIPVTSTSILFGATPLDATFPHQKHQQGLARRFLNYFSSVLERFIAWPETAQIENIARTFVPLLDYRGPLTLESEAFNLWEKFQRQNRKALKDTPEERAFERYALNSQPTHTLKVAIIFEACRAVFCGLKFIPNIRRDTLETAIAHVDQCLAAGRVLAGAGKRLETRQEAEVILAHIQGSFTPDTKYPDVIFVDRTHLTRKFSHNDFRRRDPSKTGSLFLETIPYLIETGDALLAYKKGRLEVFGFRAGYYGPDDSPKLEDSTPPGSKNRTISSVNPANSSNFLTGKTEVSRGNPEAISSNSSISSSPDKISEMPLGEIDLEEIGQNDGGPDQGISESDLSTRLQLGENSNVTDNLTPVPNPGGECSKGSEQDSEIGGSAASISSTLFDQEENEEIEEIARDSRGELPHFQLRKFEEIASKNEEIAVWSNTWKCNEFTYVAYYHSAESLFEAFVSAPATQITLDFETYGKDRRAGLHPHLGDIRLLTVALASPAGSWGRIAVFDLKRLGTNCLPWRDLFKGREVIVHNGMFEFKWALMKLGVRLENIFDTMHAARLLQNGIDGGRQHAGLATIVERYLGRTLSKTEQKSDFGRHLLTRSQIEYAASDVEHLLDLRGELYRLLEEADGGSMLPVFRLDMEHLPVLALREMCGIRFDVSLANALLADAKEAIDRAQTRLCQIWGKTVSLSSPVQVKAAFKKIGFKDIPNTADDTLKGIDHEAARLMQQHRSAEATVKEVERLLEYVHPDGRIYPDLDPLGTDTGRILSSKPTINNLSVDTGVRSCILPDKPGYVVVKSDFSKEEPRITAVVFNVRALKHDFLARRNIYTGFAAQIFGNAPEALLPAQLEVGKANFIGAVYGLSWKRMVSDALTQRRTLTEELAKQILTAFKELYPEIRAAWQKAKHDADRGLIRFGKSKLGRRKLLRPMREQPTKSFVDRFLGPAEVNFFGSKEAARETRRLSALDLPPEGKSESAKVKNNLRRTKVAAAREKMADWNATILPELEAQIAAHWNETEPRRASWEAQQLLINYKIQAGGSDVIRKAEILVESRLPANCRILLSNHDEICVSCPKEKAQQVAEIVQAAMGEAFNWLYPSVPIESEAEISETWK
jgi:DNA polymerase I-like protein with 3'-5' exonuclease and polymerase domains